MFCKAFMFFFISFKNQFTSLVDCEDAVDIFYLNFSNAFDDVLHLVSKLVKCGLVISDRFRRGW